MKRKIFFCLISIISIFGLYAQDSDEYGYNSFKPDSVVVSSTLKEKSKPADFYGCKNLYDSSWRSWVEGESDDGIHSTITYKYKSRHNLRYLMVMNGYGELRYYYKNNRVKDLKISDGKKEIIYTLRDTYLPQFIELDFYDCNEVTFEILSVYKGTVYSDTCISELRLVYYPSDQTFYFEPDDYTKKAMELIPNFKQFKCIYGDLYKYKPVNRYEGNEVVLAYIKTGKLLLILKEKDKKNDRSIISYKEFDGKKWIDSNDGAFDYLKSLNIGGMGGCPIDSYPYKTDFYTRGDLGLKCFILTPDGFEEVFDFVSEL